MWTDKELYEIVGLYHQLKEWRISKKDKLTYDENAHMGDALRIVYGLTMDIAGKVTTPPPSPENEK